MPYFSLMKLQRTKNILQSIVDLNLNLAFNQLREDCVRTSSEEYLNCSHFELSEFVSSHTVDDDFSTVEIANNLQISNYLRIMQYENKENIVSECLSGVFDEQLIGNDNQLAPEIVIGKRNAVLCDCIPCMSPCDLRCSTTSLSNNLHSFMSHLPNDPRFFDWMAMESSSVSGLPTFVDIKSEDEHRSVLGDNLFLASESSVFMCTDDGKSADVNRGVNEDKAIPVLRSTLMDGVVRETGGCQDSRNINRPRILRLCDSSVSKKW